MRNFSLPILVLGLTGCVSMTSFSSYVGQSKGLLISKQGLPVRTTALPNGERLNYSRGPDGLSTYFVYLDNEGKVRNIEQVVTEENFKRIKPGMTREEVINTLGDPPKRHDIGRDRGYVWSYRSFSTMCIWFQIEFTGEDIVRSTGHNRRPTGIVCR